MPFRMSRRSVLPLIIDFIAGIATIGILIVIAAAVHKIQNLTVAVAVVAAASFIVAFARGRAGRRTALLTGVALGAGLLLPILGIAIRFLPNIVGPSLWLMLAILLVLVFCGAYAATSTIRSGRTALTVILALAAAFALHHTLQRSLSSNSSSIIDKTVAPFTLVGASGQSIASRAPETKVLVLDFWGTWCAPCIAEMPAYEDVQRHFQDDASVKLLAVNEGWNEDTPAKAKAFREQRNWNTPLAFDPKGALQNLGGTALPYIVVLDGKGHMRFTSTGFSSKQEMERTLIAIITQVQHEQS